MSQNMFIQECVSHLDTKVVGHDQAKYAIAKALFGLQNPLRKKGVLGVLYLNGPTGVGKDELIKATAGFLFKNTAAYTNIPFESISSTADIFGSMPGTVGYNDNLGLHQKRIFSHYNGDSSIFHPSAQRHQVSIISISEIDKAKKSGHNQNVIQSLLTVLSDGKASMTDGTVTDLSNSLIVITGNTGIDKSNSQIGFSKDEDNQKKVIMSQIKDLLSPEFMGRIDYFIQLENLTEQEYKKIILLQLTQTESKISQLFGSKVKIDGLSSSSIVDYIFRHINKEKGARDIEDFIYDKIGTTLGLIITGSLDSLQENDQLSISLSIVNNEVVTEQSIHDTGVPTTLGEYGKELEKNLSKEEEKKNIIDEIISNLNDKHEIIKSLRKSNRRLWFLVLLMVGYLGYNRYTKEKAVDKVAIYQQAFQDAIKALKSDK